MSGTAVNREREAQGQRHAATRTGGPEVNRPHVAVSVVVSVRGNAGSLAALLAALAGQETGLADMEAVIVDNDPPGPDRPATRAAAARAWPFPVRVVAEPRPGLSAGRNRGICAARGDYIAITDPDIVPAPGWLRALLTAAREEQAFAVGGRTTVDYTGGQAFPLPRGLAECHGPVDWPAGRAPALWPYWVTGCNLLFERQQALELGLFRTDLGRRGRWLGDCEDLEFVDRARQHGLRIMIEPSALVTHPVRRRETTAWYLIRQGAGHGTCLARMHQSVAVEPAAIRSGPAHAAAALAAFVGGCRSRDAGSAVTGLRDLSRIASYQAELTRLRALRRPLLPAAPMTLQQEGTCQ
jgi:GT2 family glycosyltransferase